MCIDRPQVKTSQTYKIKIGQIIYNQGHNITMWRAIRIMEFMKTNELAIKKAENKR